MSIRDAVLQSVLSELIVGFLAFSCLAGTVAQDFKGFANVIEPFKCCKGVLFVSLWMPANCQRPKGLTNGTVICLSGDLQELVVVPRHLL